MFLSPRFTSATAARSDSNYRVMNATSMLLHLLGNTGGHLFFHPHHLAVTHCKLASSAQRLGGSRGRGVNNLSKGLSLI